MRGRYGKASTTIVAVLTATIMLMTAAPAAAHYLDTGWQHTYRTSSLCVKNYAQLSHDAQNPGGRHSTGVENWSYAVSKTVGPFECWWAMEHPKKIRLVVWKRQSDNSWAICKDSGEKSYGPSWRQELIRNYGTNAPCGSGYYTTWGYGWAWYTGAWRGGRVKLSQYSSPSNHRLPDSGLESPPVDCDIAMPLPIDVPLAQPSNWFKDCP